MSASNNIPVRTFSPSSDQAQSLGEANTRWGTLYTREINDGEGASLSVSDASEATTVALARNHNELTLESRSAENSHPIEAITGLNEVLQPATQGKDGLLSSIDKAKLDNLDVDNIVYHTVQGDIRLQNAKKLLGISLGGEDSNLIGHNDLDHIEIGSMQFPLVFSTKTRPVIQTEESGGTTVESLAYFSDLASFVSKTWEIASVDDLVTLTGAKQNDYGRIVEGDDAGDVYLLLNNDPTDINNWLNITTSGGVISVNGKIGAVDVDLADFPDVQSELSERAPVSDPVFTGVPCAPTAPIGTNSAQIATTAFVQDSILWPVSAVMYFATTIPPQGWLKANGAAVSRADYSDLFTAIGTTFGEGDGTTTFNLPDLRGEFVRGFDDGRGIDESREFGSAQQDALVNLSGSVTGLSMLSTNNSNPANQGVIAVTSTGSGFTYGAAGAGRAITGISFSTDRTVNTAEETRPRNVALLACIKY